MRVEKSKFGLGDKENIFSCRAEGAGEVAGSYEGQPRRELEGIVNTIQGSLIFPAIRLDIASTRLIIPHKESLDLIMRGFIRRYGTISKDLVEELVLLSIHRVAYMSENTFDKHLHRKTIQSSKRKSQRTSEQERGTLDLNSQELKTFMLKYVINSGVMSIFDSD